MVACLLVSAYANEDAEKTESNNDQKATGTIPLTSSEAKSVIAIPHCLRVPRLRGPDDHGRGLDQRRGQRFGLWPTALRRQDVISILAIWRGRYR